MDPLLDTGCDVPEPVLSAYGFAKLASDQISQGLVNMTFRVVNAEGQPCAIVQRLHPSFGPLVNADLDMVTQHLARNGMTTPRLIRTRAGKQFFQYHGIWRALTFVQGRTVERLVDERMGKSAAALVARFHRTISDLRYVYQHTRNAVHDTSRHLEILAERLATGEDKQSTELAKKILSTADQLEPLPPLPLQHTHGDLKISNILFDSDKWIASCLVDLDTCQKQPMHFELGDMLRSWCNPAGEDTRKTYFDVSMYDTILQSYFRESGHLLTPQERAAIPLGLATICIELAARFCVDAFDQAYFGWDATRFESRREHNLIRAEGQLNLMQQVMAAMPCLRAHLG